MKYDSKKIKVKEEMAKKDVGVDLKGSDRVPPGQRLTTGFPVLDLGVQPDFDDDYQLEVFGMVEPKVYSFSDVKKMPSKEFTEDFHCVTHWSRLDLKWKGIPFLEFLKVVKPDPKWKFLIQHGMDDYTTNVPREDLERDDVFIAFELEGKPIPREHGWPIRLIIPHLYGWKGCKFLKGLEFTDKDRKGFWEKRGYHNHGDPWKQERYSLRGMLGL